MAEPNEPDVEPTDMDEELESDEQVLEETDDVEATELEDSDSEPEPE